MGKPLIGTECLGTAEKVGKSDLDREITPISTNIADIYSLEMLLWHIGFCDCAGFWSTL